MSSKASESKTNLQLTYTPINSQRQSIHVIFTKINDEWSMDLPKDNDGKLIRFTMNNCFTTYACIKDKEGKDSYCELESHSDMFFQMFREHWNRQKSQGSDPKESELAYKCVILSTFNEFEATLTKVAEIMKQPQPPMNRFIFCQNEKLRVVNIVFVKS